MRYKGVLYIVIRYLIYKHFTFYVYNKKLRYSYSIIDLTPLGRFLPYNLMSVYPIPTVSTNENNN